MQQMQYNMECSPPYDQDEEEGEGTQEHNMKFIEKLVCEDDEFDPSIQSNRSVDEHSQHSLHSPDA